MAARYVRIGQYPDYRDEIRGTLLEILASTANPGTKASPNDVAGCTLEMGADGKWYGDLGTMPKATADALYASGALANLATGATYRDTSGTQYTYSTGAGWVADPQINQFHAGDISLFGNSIIELNGARYSQAMTDNYSSRGFAVVAATQCGGRIKIIENLGVGGQNTIGLVARLDQVRDTPAGTVVVLESSNDAALGVSAASVWPRYVSIITAILGAGKNCVLCTGIPRTTMTETQKTFYQDLRALILGYSAVGYYPCDTYAPMLDPDGTAVDGTLADGIHPNAMGAFLMSGPLAATLNAISPRRNEMRRLISLGSNCLLNPLFAGSSGAPTSWIEQNAATSWSYVARPDNSGATSAKAVASTAGQSVIILQNVAIASLPISTRIRACVRLKATNLNPAPPVQTQMVHAYAQYYNGSTFTGRIDSGYWDTNPTAYENQPLSGELVLRTNPGIIPAGTTLTQLVIAICGGGEYQLMDAYLGEDI